MCIRDSTPLVPYPSGALVPERDVDYMPVLEARHLGIDFGGLTAVDDFSLTIGRTEIAGLIGPNGAGKTTVFNLLTSVYQPTRGSVLISGMPTAGKSTYQVSQMGIARTFQNIRLYNNLSVLDNVKVGMQMCIRDRHESEHYRCHDRTGEPSCLPYVLHQWHFLRRFHDHYSGLCHSGGVHFVCARAGTGPAAGRSVPAGTGIRTNRCV